MVKYHLEEKEDLVIIHFFGELTLENIRDVKGVWTKAVQEKPKTLAIDFGGVNHIDSAGMIHLIQLSKIATVNEVELIFYDVVGEVINLFKLATLDRFFNIFTKDYFEKEYLNVNS